MGLEKGGKKVHFKKGKGDLSLRKGDEKKKEASPERYSLVAGNRGGRKKEKDNGSGERSRLLDVTAQPNHKGTKKKQAEKKKKVREDCRLSW